MIAVEKQRLRARMRELAPVVPAEDPLELIERIVALNLWKDARSVLLFSPLADEPDPLPLLQVAGKRRLLFPRIEGEELGLFLHHPESRWITGPHGLREPDPETWERGTAREIDLALIPGLAFDPAGGRLGRGRGFYDRLLGRPDFLGTKAGVCQSWRLVERVPCGERDIRVDLVVTPRGVHPAGSMLDKPAERG